MKWCNTPAILDQEDIKRIVQDVRRKCSPEALKRNKLLSSVLRNVRGDGNGNEVLKFCQKPFDFFDNVKETDKEM